MKSGSKGILLPQTCYSINTIAIFNAGNSESCLLLIMAQRCIFDILDVLLFDCSWFCLFASLKLYIADGMAFLK